MTRAVLAALTLLLSTCAMHPVFAEERGVTFGALATAQVVLSGDTDPAVVPGIRLSARGPFAFGDATPLETYASLELTALPGETVDLGDVATFRAAEFVGGLAFKVGEVRRGTQTIRTLIFAEASFATRLPRDPGPLDRYPRRIMAGVEVREESSGSSLKVGYGDADVAGPTGWRQVIVGGEVPLYSLPGTNVDLLLGGDAVLTIGKDPFAAGGQRDVFRVWIGARIGG